MENENGPGFSLCLDNINDHDSYFELIYGNFNDESTFANSSISDDISEGGITFTEELSPRFNKQFEKDMKEEEENDFRNKKPKKKILNVSSPSLPILNEEKSNKYPDQWKNNNGNYSSKKAKESFEKARRSKSDESKEEIESSIRNNGGSGSQLNFKKRLVENQFKKTFSKKKTFYNEDSNLPRINSKKKHGDSILKLKFNNYSAPFSDIESTLSFNEKTDHLSSKANKKGIKKKEMVLRQDSKQIIHTLKKENYQNLIRVIQSYGVNKVLFLLIFNLY
eukprot:TRINITY_DN2944_c0_g1_i1.p1 TRINITY_DN2944_c0_g1~~TRINITY_DN2944_c0_g1_i1.p1  ORF type:complete len:279 (-),score=76.17 TRINITY_DN2944_c0_g1_i1:3-839(-)